eukprot:jgi/Astpho2/5316/Aster-x0248
MVHVAATQQQQQKRYVTKTNKRPAGRPGHHRKGTAQGEPATLQNNISPAPSLPTFNKYRALVLDTSYRPIDIINWQRAICLDIFDKVDVLEYYDVFAHSAHAQFMLPAVLRVRMYVQRDHHGRIALSRRNIMLRDGLACQYCNRKHELTIDHVVPASKGGAWAWDNLVTACETCNSQKGNSSLKQMGWKLKQIPKEPTPWQVGVLVGLDNCEVKSTPPEWQNWLPAVYKTDEPTIPEPVII